MPAAPKAAIASQSDARSCSFPRSARIPGAEGFDRCVKQRSIHRSGAFAFHVVWIDGPVDGTDDAAVDAADGAAADPPGWRLGLVIPKRLVRSAVARNTIKRRWREACRRQREAWAAEFGAADLVIRMHSPLTPRLVFDAPAMLTVLAERMRSRGAGGTAQSAGARREAE